VATQQIIGEEIKKEFETLTTKLKAIEQSIQDMIDDTTTIHTQQTKNDLLQKLGVVSDAADTTAQKAKDTLAE
jgi:hypothetical protein